VRDLVSRFTRQINDHPEHTCAYSFLVHSRSCGTWISRCLKRATPSQLAAQVIDLIISAVDSIGVSLTASFHTSFVQLMIADRTDISSGHSWHRGARYV
jgi:hypothetical protein